MGLRDRDVKQQGPVLLARTRREDPRFGGDSPPVLVVDEITWHPNKRAAASHALHTNRMSDMTDTGWGFIPTEDFTVLIAVEDYPNADGSGGDWISDILGGDD